MCRAVQLAAVPIWSGSSPPLRSTPRSAIRPRCAIRASVRSTPTATKRSPKKSTGRSTTKSNCQLAGIRLSPSDPRMSRASDCCWRLRRNCKSSAMPTQTPVQTGYSSCTKAGRRFGKQFRSQVCSMPKKPSVLVVDDFVDGREMVAEYLAFRGFAVTEARDGDEAIELAKKLMPEIVLMDLRSEEHTSELQSLRHLVCRLLLEKKKKT